MIKKIPVILCVMCIFASESFPASGATGWWIFRRPQSTKPKPITAVASVRGDLSGVFYNPSILGTITQKEIFLLTETGLADDAFGGLVYGMPIEIGNGAGISAGIVYYDAGRTSLYWIESGAEQERTVSVQKDMMGIVSYGQNMGKINIGLSLKYATSNIIETKSAAATAFDLGVLMMLEDNISLSMAGQNIGSSSAFLDKPDELPTSVWLGGAYAFSPKVNAGLDLAHIVNEEKTIPSVAVEYSLGSLSLNLSYKFNVEESALQIGICLATDKFDFGYALIPAQYLSTTHRLSVGYKL